jgi:hypothetical protein
MSSKKPSNGKVSRREFIGGAAVGLAIPYVIAGDALAMPVRPFPNERTGADGDIRPYSTVLRDMLSNLQHGDTAARYTAVKQATLVGTEAIPPLARVYAGSDPAAAKAASEALRRIAYHAGRPGAPAEAKAAAIQLQKLTGQEYPREVRAEAIRYLGYVGDKEAIPALIELLGDRDVREDARMALECIPGREADAALRTAARSMPDYRVALEQSLKHRSTKLKDVGTRK